MRHLTSWSEYRRGKLPPDMTARWSILGNMTRVEASSVDPSTRNSLLVNAATAGDHGIYTWNVIDSDSGVANQEIHSISRLVVPGSETQQVRLHLRSSGTLASMNGYELLIGSSNSHIVRKKVNGVNTTLQTFNKTIGVGSVICAVFRANGSNLFAKVWLYGDTEPVGWDTTPIVDTSHATGWAGPGAFWPDSATEYKLLSLATNGDATLRESDLEESLYDWIGRGEELMEIWAKFEYYNPITAAVEEVWTSNFERSTAAYDFPPSVDKMLPVLKDIGNVGSRLESDIQFGGVVSSQRSQIKLDNRPSKTTGAGPLSHWHNYSFYGRQVEIRVGKRWKVRPSPAYPNGILSSPRSFELLDCLVAGDPEIGAEVSIPVGAQGQDQQGQGAATSSSVSLGPVAGNKNPPIGALSNRLAVGINVGISTGIKALSNAGYIQIPYKAQYSLTSWRVSLRFMVPTVGVAGASNGWFSRWYDGVSAYQWSIALGHASHPTLGNKLFVTTHANDGTVLFTYTHDKLLNDGNYHSLILALSNQDRWYLILDDIKIAGAGGLVKSCKLPVTGLEALRVLSGVTMLDHRIEKFVSEDEAIDRFTVRRDSDANTLSIHRCDDNAGASTSVTDYGPVANSATLVGTDLVDRAYVPTYLGSPELTGVYMPMSAGTLYNAQAQSIDPLREIFRYNDKAKTAGVTLGVRAKGLTISSMSYTEPSEGPGTFDMNGASDQPMTFGLTSSSTPEDPRIHLPRLLRDELFSRGAVNHSTCDSESFDAIRQALPLKGGISYIEPPSISDFLTNSLSPLGCNFSLRQGRVVAGVLLPPLNPTPFGYGPLIEFLGWPNRGLTLNHDSSYSLTQQGGFNFSLTFAFKLATWFVPDLSVSSVFSYFPSGQTIIDKCGTTASGFYVGFDGRDGGLIFGTPGLTSGLGLHYRKIGNYTFWTPGVWYIGVATVNNNADRALAVRYIKPGTSTIIDIGDVNPTADLACSGAMTANTLPIKIGHGSKGSLVNASVGYVYGCCPSQGVPALQGDPITDGMVAGASAPAELRNGAAVERFRIFLNEGTGDVSYDRVLNRPGLIEGVRWSPKLTLDSRIVTRGNPSSVKRTNALWRVETRYRLNRSPLSGADVVASVSASERMAIGQPFLYDVSVARQTLETFLNSRDLTLTTDLINNAEPITKMLKVRLTSDRRLAFIQDWYRETAKADNGDEILVYDDIYWPAGRAMRLINMEYGLMTDKANLTLWG